MPKLKEQYAREKLAVSDRVIQAPVITPKPIPKVNPTVTVSDRLPTVTVSDRLPTVTVSDRVPTTRVSAPTPSVSTPSTPLPVSDRETKTNQKLLGIPLLIGLIGAGIILFFTRKGKR